MAQSKIRDHWILGVGLLVLTWVYFPHFSNGYQFDDTHTIVENAAIRDLSHVGEFFSESWPSSNLPQNRTFRPLVTLSFALEYALLGRNEPIVSHVSNFVVFVGILLLLLEVTEGLLRSWTSLPQISRRRLSIVTVGVFGFHTAHAETLNYLIARSDLFATFFLLFAFWIRLKHRGRAVRFLECVAVLLGVLSKQTAAMYPVWIVLFEILNRRSIRSSILESLPSLMVVTLVAGYGIRITSGDFVPGGSSLYRYVITQPYVLLRYLKEFVLPTGLTADTDWAPFESVFRIEVVVGFLFVLVWAVFAAFHSLHQRGSRLLGFAMFSFLLFHVPTSAIVPLAEVTNDHRMFLPNLGLVWFVTALAVWVRSQNNLSQKSNGLLVLCFLAFLSAHAFGIRARTRVWSSSYTLWKDVTEKSPRNGRGWMNFGLAQMSKGDLDGAEASFLEGLKHWPRYSYLKTNLGVLRETQGRTSEAEFYYRSAVQDAPTNPVMKYYLAHFLWKKGNVSEAVPLMQEAIARASSYLLGRRLLIAYFDERAQGDALRALVLDTLRIYPGDPVAAAFETSDPVERRRRLEAGLSSAELINFGLELYRIREFGAALQVTQAAETLEPTSATVHNNLCSYLMELKRFKEALNACDRALALDAGFVQARNNRKQVLELMGVLK